MTIRKKVLSIAGGVLFALLAVNSVVSYFMITNGFTRLENKALEDRVSNIHNQPDVTGNPATVLEIKQNREIYRYALQTWRYLILAMAAGSLAFWALLMVLLDRSILHRVRELMLNLNNLPRKENRLEPLKIKHNDEIGHLTQSINHLLESLHQYHLLQIENERKALKDLEKSENKYRKFFDDDITGDFITTMDGQILECNQSFARIFGYQSVEEVKKIPIKQFYASKEHRKMLINRLRKEKRLQGVELEFIHRNGRPIYCIGNLIGHFNDRGDLVEIGGYFFDDTKRIVLEKDLRQAQKLEAIGTLAGGIAHDFNNILSGIMGYSELVLNEMPSSDPAAARIQNIIKAVHRARELIQQILTFSRQREGEIQPVKIMPILKEVAKLLRASLPSTIDICMPHQFPSTVQADPVQLHQVVMNLCTNAGYAMRKKGGCLSISVDEVKLDKEFTDRYPGATPGAFARISIEDTGGGIADDIKDRIFDPFFSTKDKSEGTGLGLSMVHGIVTRFKGAITVSNTPAGSLFEVYLPCIESVQESPENESVAVPKGAESIVFIDDENFQVDICTQMLEALGYHATGFTQSTDALGLAQK